MSHGEGKILTLLDVCLLPYLIVIYFQQAVHYGRLRSTRLVNRTEKVTMMFGLPSTNAIYPLRNWLAHSNERERERYQRLSIPLVADTSPAARYQSHGQTCSTRNIVDILQR